MKFNLDTAVENLFYFLALGFDKIPFLKAIKGYRTLIGLIVLAGLEALDQLHVGGGGLFAQFSPYIVVFTGLALNAKGRE